MDFSWSEENDLLHKTIFHRCSPFRQSHQAFIWIKWNNKLFETLHRNEEQAKKYYSSSICREMFSLNLNIQLCSAVQKAANFNIIFEFIWIYFVLFLVYGKLIHSTIKMYNKIKWNKQNQQPLCQSILIFIVVFR